MQKELMDHEIWRYSFPMKKGMWDNDYVFYRDGRIMHCYDKNISKFNIEEFVSAEQISLEERNIMLSNAPETLKGIITDILKL